MQSKTTIRSLFSPSGAAINNGLFAVLSLLGSALSYLLYPVLAKLITPVQFGDVSVVIALAGQISGLLLAFNVVSIYIVNTYELETALKITEAIQKFVIQVLVVVTIAVMVASPWLAHWLKIGNPVALGGLGLILLLSVPAVLWTGYLQGHNELARIGVYNLVVAAGKLVLAGALAVMGWGAVGAVVGILLGQLVGLVVLRLVPGTRLPSVWSAATRISQSEVTALRRLAGYVLTAMVVVGVYSVLFAVDIVLAKAFFGPREAGLYAGVSALGRIIFFGAGILTWILLANLSAKEPEAARATLRRYLGLIAVGGGLVAGAFALGATDIVRLSLGPAYVVMAPQLWLAGLNQLIASLLYAYTLYLLVLRKSQPALLAVATSGLAVGVAVAMHPAGPRQLLVGLILGQLAGLIVYAMIVSGLKLMRRRG